MANPRRNPSTPRNQNNNDLRVADFQVIPAEHPDPEVTLAENLTKEAEAIKLSIEKLNARLLESETLKKQYELYLKGQITFPGADDIRSQTNAPLEEMAYDATTEFMDLLKCYAALSDRYTEVVKGALHNTLVSPKEMQTIESCAKLNKKNYTYFPLYQEALNSHKSQINNRFFSARDDKWQRCFDIELAYTHRRYKYQRWHAIAGLSSFIFGIGLPFFVAGLVSHALDKMITKIREHRLEKNIKKVEANRQQALVVAENDLKAEINNDHRNRLRQSIFETTQTKTQQPTIEVSPGDKTKLERVNYRR